MDYIKENIISNPLFVKIAGTLLLMAAGIVAIKIITRISRKALGSSKLDPVLHNFIFSLLKVILWAVLVFTVFAYVGLSISSLVTLTAAVGAAAALALQESLGNFAGGILILFSKPFSRGDLIEDTEISGRVQQIDLLYTTLATVDNKIVTIPNGKLANSKIINHSKANIRRVDCKFGISYESDISKAKHILRTIASESPLILDDPEYIIGVSDHDASAVIIDMLVWCRTADYYNTKYYLEEEVKNRFDEGGIVIPFDQITVHFGDRGDRGDRGDKENRENKEGEAEAKNVRFG